MSNIDSRFDLFSGGVSRRQMLLDAGGGFGWLALSWLLNQQKAGAASTSSNQLKPHFPAKAQRVVQVFCVGGMSHLDTFDYKPKLSERTGAAFDMPTFFGQAGNLMGSLWEFQQHGQRGLWVSRLDGKSTRLNSSHIP